MALAFRPESPRRRWRRAVAGLDRAGRCTVIELGPLDDAEIAALVEPGLDAGPRRVARIVAMAEGNPFFALELARAGGGAVPPSVWAAITERLLDLDEPTRGAAAPAGGGRRRPGPVRRARA